MYTIGIISNWQQAASEIKTVGQGFFNQNKFSFTIFLYDNTSEIPDIVKKNPQICAWICSGPTPYYHAIPHVLPETPIVTCNIVGLEFYRYLFYLLLSSPSGKLRISMDRLKSSANAWETIFQESAQLGMSIPQDEIYLNDFEDLEIDNVTQEIADWHVKLYQEGKTDKMLTSSTKIYKELTKRQMPVVQMHGSRFSIEAALTKLNEKMTYLHMKNNRVAVLRLEAQDPDSLYFGITDSLALQKLDMKIKPYVLSLCKSLPDSYISQKDGPRYEIFISRRAIMEHLSDCQQMLNDIKLQAGLDMCLGVGIGRTTFDAFKNTMKALSYARQQKPVQPLVIIDSNGQIMENVHSDKEISFMPKISDPVLLNLLQTTGISVKNYAKAAAVTARIGHPFTPTEFAHGMNITERSARRIITQFVQAGLMENVGEESLAQRGRPAQRYLMKQCSDTRV